MTAEEEFESAKRDLGARRRVFDIDDVAETVLEAAARAASFVGDGVEHGEAVVRGAARALRWLERETVPPGETH